jgi:hypothetical protein
MGVGDVPGWSASVGVPVSLMGVVDVFAVGGGVSPVQAVWVMETRKTARTTLTRIFLESMTMFSLKKIRETPCHPCTKFF